MEELIKNEATRQDMTQEVFKRARKRFSNVGLMFFCGTLIVYGVQYASLFLFQWLKPEWTESMTGRLLITMLPMYIIALPLLVWLLGRIPAIEKRPVQRRKMSAGQVAVAFIMCYAVMYISNLIGIFITLIIGLLKGGAVQNTVAQVASGASLWFNIIVMVIAAPIFEELIFRKLLVDRVAQYGEGVAIVLSGLIFGLFHGNLNQFVYAFTLGMFLAFLYIKTRSIKYTIILHMLINFVGGVLGIVVLKLANLDSFAADLLSNMGDLDQMMQVYMDNMQGLIVFGVYVMILLGVVIAGIVLWIVFRKRFRLLPGETPLPRGRRFSAVVVNVGMALYILFWIAMIIFQLFV